MNSDSHNSARLYSRDGSSSKLVLSVLPHVDIARQLCPSTLVNDISRDLSISDDGGVLLARTDGCAIPWEGRVN